MKKINKIEAAKQIAWKKSNELRELQMNPPKAKLFYSQEYLDAAKDTSFQVGKAIGLGEAQFIIKGQL